MLKSFARGANNRLRLMAKVGGQLPVRSHHLGWRMDFFSIPRRVRSNLGSFLPGVACAFEILTNLLAAGT
jgi:hypothetical protein